MPESSAWSDAVNVRETPAGCQASGSGAPATLTLGGVRSTCSTVEPISRDATPAAEIARDLIVTSPSGKPVRWYTPSDPVSEVASGSLPSLVTE